MDANTATTTNFVAAGTAPTIGGSTMEDTVLRRPCWHLPDTARGGSCCRTGGER